MILVVMNFNIISRDIGYSLRHYQFGKPYNCYAMGTAVPVGIGILNVMTPFSYFAVAVSVLPSLVDIGSIILLSILIGLCL